MSRYYGKIKLKEKHNGKKIWYINDCYLCDCVNLPFESKEEAQKGVEWFKSWCWGKYPYITGNVESITIHRLNEIGGK